MNAGNKRLLRILLRYVVLVVLYNLATSANFWQIYRIDWMGRNFDVFPFNTDVDRTRGNGVKKVSVFVHAQGLKTSFETCLT